MVMPGESAMGLRCGAVRMLDAVDLLEKTEDTVDVAELVVDKVLRGEGMYGMTTK